MGRNNFIHLPSCHSTNDFAMEMVKRGEAVHGTVIITDEQTKGRGQFGNSWEAEPGQNLTFSVIYKTDFILVTDQFQLNVAVSVALQRVISQFIDNVSIKWPNDILVEKKKVCGILIENTTRGKNLGYSVIGIGLNVNQEKFDSPFAASFSSLSGLKYDLGKILSSVLLDLDFCVSNLDNEKSNPQLIDYYSQHLFQKGILAKYASNSISSGVISGVDHQGRLVVDSEGVLYYFNTKEIKFLL